MCLTARLLLVALAFAGVATPANADLVFGAPPREDYAKAMETYEPIARLLSKILDEKVVYRYAQNWLTYQSEMRKGLYDIVLDGPHFNGWRMAKLGHVPLVKLSGDLSFVVVVRNGTDPPDLKQLAGRPICAHAPPNLATLATLQQFPNAARQPVVLETQGFPAGYKGVVDGRCVGTVLPTKVYEALDKDAHATKVIFHSRSFPNQALSVGPKVKPHSYNKLIQALLSEEGKRATSKLREEFKGDLVRATRQEYEGLGALLQDTWGFQL